MRIPKRYLVNTVSSKSILNDTIANFDQLLDWEQVAKSILPYNTLDL